MSEEKELSKYYFKTDGLGKRFYDAEDGNGEGSHLVGVLAEDREDAIRHISLGKFYHHSYYNELDEMQGIFSVKRFNGGEIDDDGFDINYRNVLSIDLSNWNEYHEEPEVVFSPKGMAINDINNSIYAYNGRIRDNTTESNEISDILQNKEQAINSAIKISNKAQDMFLSYSKAGGQYRPPKYAKEYKLCDDYYIFLSFFRPKSQKRRHDYDSYNKLKYDLSAFKNSVVSPWLCKTGNHYHVGKDATCRICSGKYKNLEEDYCDYIRKFADKYEIALLEHKDMYDNNIVKLKGRIEDCKSKLEEILDQ